MVSDWDKATVSKVLGIVVSLLLALLSVFGYDVVIAQPKIEGLSAQVRALEGRVATSSVTLEPFCACPGE